MPLMPWELTRPAGLVLLGLLPPLIVLYLLRVRRERRRVSSIWLFRKATQDLAASRPYRRLVASVPLILESLALVALALSAARPELQTNRLEAPRAVIVVDQSASMGTREGATTRLELARAAVRDVLARLSPGSEVMLLGASREAELVSPFERDRTRLDAALARLEVAEVEGRLGPALALASEQLRQSGGGTLVVITDGAVADAEDLVVPPFPLEVIRVGSHTENTAIVRTDVTRGIDPVSGRDRVEVFALLVHRGERARDVFVTLSQRNVVEPLAARRLRLEPGEHVPVVLGFEPAKTDEGTGLVVTLSPGDALASDDSAGVRVPESGKLPVVLAPRNASPWLRRALAADPDVELFAAELDGLSPEDVPYDALVVVDGACPQALPGAHLLIVNPPEGQCRTVTVGAREDAPVVTSWAESDPRLRFLTFEGVRIARARRLRAESSRAELVRARDAVVIADASSPGRTATIVGFDVGESNWPLTASFVVFVRNVAELARAERAHLVPRAAHTGEPLPLRVPLDATRVVVTPDDGKPIEVPARAGVAVLPAPTRVGFLHASWDGSRAGSTLVPAQLGSAAESNVAPRELPLSGAHGSSTTTGDVGTVRDLSGVLAVIALLLVAADVWWITRGARPARSTLAPGSRVAP
ncbi:MAG: VWA domain-containing protein [Pseudomonadota bacterium]|nr:MAG: hypothetical protein DIU78_15305 [Pseudomonadota bacterium]